MQSRPSPRSSGCWPLPRPPFGLPDSKAASLPRGGRRCRSAPFPARKSASPSPLLGNDGEVNYVALAMSEFASWLSYQQFAASVAREWRFTRSAGQKAFIDAVLATACSRHDSIPLGAILWRAQEGHGWYEEQEGVDLPVPLLTERMKPERDRAKEGRANPKGLPYLYTASHRETAISEVRPWIGAYVSVSEFTVVRPLTIVNCTSQASGSPLFYLKEPEPSEREAANWKAIDRAFSRPVTPNDHLADYVPTQILAEAFRHHGLDGIGYRSALGPGHNIVLFDLDAAVVSQRILCRVQSLKLDTENQEPVPRPETITSP